FRRVLFRSEHCLFCKSSEREAKLEKVIKSVIAEIINFIMILYLQLILIELFERLRMSVILTWARSFRQLSPSLIHMKIRFVPLLMLMIPSDTSRIGYSPLSLILLLLSKVRKEISPLSAPI